MDWLKEFWCDLVGHRFVREDGSRAPHVGDATCARCGIHRVSMAPIHRRTQDLPSPARPAPSVPECKPHRIEVISLADGDTLVINVPGRLDVDQRAKMKTAALEALPEGVKVLVLEGGVTIHALRSTSRTLSDMQP